MLTFILNSLTQCSLFRMYCLYWLQLPPWSKSIFNTYGEISSWKRYILLYPSEAQAIASRRPAMARRATLLYAARKQKITQNQKKCVILSPAAKVDLLFFQTDLKFWTVWSKGLMQHYRHSVLSFSIDQ